MNAQIFSEHFMNRTTNVGIQMHRIHEINLRILSRQIPNSRTHTDKPIPEVLPPVSGDQHQSPTPIQPRRIISCLFQHPAQLFLQRYIILNLIHHHIQRINYRISRHEDPLFRNILAHQITLRQRCRSKMIRRNPSRHQPVHLLRPWTVDVPRPQSGFHMPHRYLLIERS